MSVWNPWHGCRKISTGCRNCYVYRRDQGIGKDAGQISKTGSFFLPIKKNRSGEWKLRPQGGLVYTCMTSDFFLEEADTWRLECWEMIRTRRDLQFLIITKRIHRVEQCLPEDWGDGYPNVTICCTAENQREADRRLPVLLTVRAQHKWVIHEPMLEAIEIGSYLASGQIERVLCGGESGEIVRYCSYDWILSSREQCRRYQVAFQFHQTGALFEKDKKLYRIRREIQESQAKKAGIDYTPETDPESDHEKAGQLGRILKETSIIAGTKNTRSPGSSSGHSSRERTRWLQKDLFQRIADSPFRSHFTLDEKDRRYVREKGMEVIRHHAEDFIEKRLAPAVIVNDGRQTPMRGHPVFRAQHACACCCRSCLEKWHGIPAGRALSVQQEEKIVDLLMEWIRRQMNDMA